MSLTPRVTHHVCSAFRISIVQYQITPNLLDLHSSICELKQFCSMRALYRLAKCLTLLALTTSIIVTIVPKSYPKTAALMRSSGDEKSFSTLSSKKSEEHSAAATDSIGWLMAGMSYLLSLIIDHY